MKNTNSKKHNKEMENKVSTICNTEKSFDIFYS